MSVGGNEKGFLRWDYSCRVGDKLMTDGGYGTYKDGFPWDEDK